MRDEKPQKAMNPSPSWEVIHHDMVINTPAGSGVLMWQNNTFGRGGGWGAHLQGPLVQGCQAQRFNNEPSIVGPFVPPENSPGEEKELPSSYMSVRNMSHLLEGWPPKGYCLLQNVQTCQLVEVWCSSLDLHYRPLQRRASSERPGRQL